MKSKYVSLKELAIRLGMDRSHARRFLKKIGIPTHKRRMPDSNNQACLTVTEEQAERITEIRKNEGYLGTYKSVQMESGVFYVIAIVPELDSRRIKLGFSMDVNSRIVQHRTSAPTAILIKSWACKRVWEKTVIDSLTGKNCRLILNEVFECADVDDLVKRGDKLFSLLPDPEFKVEVSKSSPLNLKLSKK